jgi:hypothetical protein
MLMAGVATGEIGVGVAGWQSGRPLTGIKLSRMGRCPLSDRR